MIIEKERLIVRISQFMYRKLYNRYKYKALIQSPFFLAIAYPIYSLFNFFYFHRVLRFYQKQIDKLSKTSQIMILGRRDFGTHLWALHYARLWEHAHGRVTLFVFTNENPHIKRLAKYILPNVEVIYPDHFFDHLFAIVFGHQFVFNYTLMRVYACLVANRPDFLHVWDLAESPYVRYNAHLDSLFSHPSAAKCNTEFLKAYRVTREQMDYRWDVFQDSFRLNYSSSIPRTQPGNLLKSLQKKLNVQRAYAIINVNTKTYPGPSARRTINHPERYNCLIDFLIEKGYDVVVHGRKEQPNFQPRKGLFNYAASPFCSIENDMALYLGCEFAITSKTGAELFTTLSDVPALGLNYMELLSMQPAKKMRFCPKHLRDVSTGKLFSWKELISEPNFFDIGQNTHGRPIEYVDLEEEEMLAALQEFLSLLPLPEEKWLDYTDLQKEFKASLNPFHLDLYLTQAVPSNSYLKKANS